MNKFLYNNKSLRDRRRELRNNQTEVEKLLWSRISKRQINNLRFNRQYSVGPYILDFYCSEIRLAIELDGSHHKEEMAKVYDKERDNFLKSANISTVRFWNDDVFKNIDFVLEKIKNKIMQIKVENWFLPPLKIRGGRDEVRKGLGIN